MFNASRTVIRQALHGLRDEGLVRIARPHPPQILQPPPKKGRHAANNRVALLFAEPHQLMGYWTLMAMEKLQRMLHSHGFDFELVIGSGINRKAPGAQLQRLMKQHQASHWIIAGTSVAMQEWFAAQPRKIICMGNTFPGISLPFVNNDLAAMSRHAVGAFHGLGHQRIVFLMRKADTSGQVKMEEGFLQGCGNTGGTIVKYSGRVEELPRQLEKIFIQRPAVTALLISGAEDTLGVMQWLLKKGIRTPQDVSLISFQWEGYLERLIQRPAWYYTDPMAHAHKLFRIILNPADNRFQPKLIFPDFHKNDTLAPAKAAGN